MTDEQTIRDVLELVGYPEGGYQPEMDAGFAALDRLVARANALEVENYGLVGENAGLRHRAETAERRLRDAPLGGDGSHWDGCWRSHIDCAVARVEAAERERDEALRIVKAIEPPYVEATQGFIDTICHYRNLAISLGAKPDDMRNSFDRGLAEKGISDVAEWNDAPETWAELEAAEARVAALEAALREIDHVAGRNAAETMTNEAQAQAASAFVRIGMVARAALAAATQPTEEGTA